MTNHELIKLLIERGANVNASNLKGETPLMMTIPFAMSVAKQLLALDVLDADIPAIQGTALSMVRSSLQEYGSSAQQVVKLHMGSEGRPMSQHEQDRIANQLAEVEQLLNDRLAVDFESITIGVHPFEMPPAAASREPRSAG